MIMDTLVYASNRTPWNRSSRRQTLADLPPSRRRVAAVRPRRPPRSAESGSLLHRS